MTIAIIVFSMLLLIRLIERYTPIRKDEWIEKTLKTRKVKATSLDKYVEIKNLADPQKAFERLDNEFIDIMYVDHFTENSVILLLDVNIDPNIEKDIVWLKELLDTVLPEIGETQYFLTPFNQE